MIDTINTVEVYEVDGSECLMIPSEKPKIRISNHWNKNILVCLELEGGKTYTVSAKDLKSAIDNSTNTAKY